MALVKGIPTEEGYYAVLATPTSRLSTKRFSTETYDLKTATKIWKDEVYKYFSKCFDTPEKALMHARANYFEGGLY